MINVGATQVRHQLLHKRSGIFYFRWRIPHDIQPYTQKRELILSLRTKDKNIAFDRALPLYKSVNDLKMAAEAYRMGSVGEEQVQQAISYVWGKAQVLSTRFKGDRKEILGAAQQRQRLAKLFPIAHTMDGEIDPADKLLLTMHENTLKQIALGLLSFDPAAPPPQNEADLMLAAEKIDQITLDNANVRLAVEKIVPELNDALGYYHQRIAKRHDIDAEITIPDHIKAQLPSAMAPATPEEPAIRLTEAWELYYQHKTDPVTGNWRNSRDVGTWVSHFKAFIEIIGGDIPANKFTRDMAKKYVSTLWKYPKNRRKHFGDAPLSEIPDAAERISGGTVKDHKGAISGLFKWLVLEEYITKNPLDDIPVDYDPNKTVRYSLAELKMLFELNEKDKQKWKFWIPRLALFTGARQAEVAQLTTSDVIKDSDSGIYYFSINDNEGKRIKSKAGIRNVPVAQILIDNGFLDYVNQLQEGSLWPDLKTTNNSLGQTVSRWWTRHDQTDPDPNGNRKVFHSLRHMAITDLINKNAAHIKVQQLVGHEHGLLKETATYFAGTPLDQLKPVIDLLDYDIDWV